MTTIRSIATVLNEFLFSAALTYTKCWLLHCYPRTKSAYLPNLVPPHTSTSLLPGTYFHNKWRKFTNVVVISQGYWYSKFPNLVSCCGTVSRVKVHLVY